MKRLFFLLFIMVFITGCGGTGDENQNENQNTSNEDSNLEDTTNDSNEEEGQQTSNLGKRSNPVPVGESVTVQSTVYSDDGETSDGDFTISLSNFQRGQEVMDFLLAENQFNDEPPEGHEWMMFDITLNVAIENPDIPYYVAPSFNVINASGSPVVQDLYPTFDTGEFGFEDVYDGGTLTGKAAVIVPTGEEVLVEYSDFDIEVFFEAE